MYTNEYPRLRTPAAARYLALSSSTLAKMRLQGDGPIFLKLNRAVAYDIRDLDAWLAIRRRTSTSDRGPGDVIHATLMDEPPSKRPTAALETDSRERVIPNRPYPKSAGLVTPRQRPGSRKHLTAAGHPQPPHVGQRVFPPRDHGESAAKNLPRPSWSDAGR
jgi:hypothetical protein